MAVELFQQGAAEGGFARADLAGELHKALALADAVEQMVEGFAMLGAVEKKARVRRDVERRLLQAIKLKILSPGRPRRRRRPRTGDLPKAESSHRRRRHSGRHGMERSEERRVGKECRSR